MSITYIEDWHGFFPANETTQDALAVYQTSLEEEGVLNPEDESGHCELSTRTVSVDGVPYIEAQFSAYSAFRVSLSRHKTASRCCKTTWCFQPACCWNRDLVLRRWAVTVHYTYVQACTTQSWEKQTHVLEAYDATEAEERLRTYYAGEGFQVHRVSAQLG